MQALRSSDPVATKTLEECIKDHHIADIEYVEATGERDRVRIRPAFIRFNRSEHLVIWGMPVGADHWEELLLDGVVAVTDTGEVFTPGW